MNTRLVIGSLSALRFLCIAAVVGGAAGKSFGQFSFNGACCFPDGTCAEMNVLNCGPLGGTPLAVGTTCTAGTCPGACCLPDGSCTQFDGPQCTSALGEYRGFGSLCADAACRDTSFTYQGRLEDAGAPADGSYDLRFRLVDAADAGAQVGPTLCVDNLESVNGLFTSRLDFGHQFATTEERHLEVAVRANTGQNCSNVGGFIVLSPRQPLTSTPRALHAESAFALDAARGGPQNAVFVDSDGDVGIGSTSPATRLHVKGPEEGIRIDGPFSGAVNQAYLAFRDLNGARIGYVGDGSDGDTNVFLASDAGDVVLHTSAGRLLTATSNGRVGVGTSIPAAKLDVRGEITLGPSGQFFAASGEENLRIVRGLVNINAPNIGSGFSVEHVATGLFTITFNPSFASLPVMTVSVELDGGDGFVALPKVTTASSATVAIVNRGGGSVDSDFSFIAIGPR